MGLTSEPTGIYGFISDDYDLGANDPRWSTGIWNLTAGSYLISGLVFRPLKKPATRDSTPGSFAS